MDSFKERLTRPFTKMEYRTLHALDDVSFDVQQGEFFGIVGRNGSGKSTLLKVLASIYRADSGRIRMAGRLAPFIELGVGFDTELTAKENTVLNGVLMGLSAREARRRLDAVMDFAELHDFEELKLKNYSSGMLVRLAFAVMVQADTDIMLIDEVLAVGDAAFAQKCVEVFRDRHRAGKTIVLVTHDMATVQDLCDRAMLIHDGRMQHLGDAEEATRQYYRLNHVRSLGGEGPVQTIRGDVNVRTVEALVLDGAGRPVTELAQREPIRLDVTLEARRELAAPEILLHVRNTAGTVVFTIAREPGADLALGGRVRLTGEVENTLVAGAYFLDCWVRSRTGSELAMQGLQLLEFAVGGDSGEAGVVAVRARLDAVALPAEGAA